MRQPYLEEAVARGRRLDSGEECEHRRDLLVDRGTGTAILSVCGSVGSGWAKLN